MDCFMSGLQKYRKLRTLLATAALLSTTCSACTFYASAVKQTRTHALASVAVGYAEVGQKDKAEEILTQALESAKAIEDFNNKEVALNQIAIKYAEAGQYDQALQVTKAMKNDDVWSLNEIAMKAAEAGEYDRAIQATKAMKKNTSQAAQVLADVVIQAAELGRYDQALMVVKAMGDKDVGYEENRAKSLAKIVDKATQTEPVGQASQILAQVLELAKSIKEDGSKAAALADVAVGYAKVGQQDKAERILAQVFQLAKTIK